MSWWSSIWKQAASDWTYAEIPPDKTPGGLGHDVIAKDAAYLNVKLRSMRIVHVRKGLSKFYGTVHSFISVPYLSGQPAVFHVITTPGDLQKVDAENIDRILVMDKRLLAPFHIAEGTSRSNWVCSPSKKPIWLHPSYMYSRLCPRRPE
jgi:hypothetical protein